MFVLALLAFSGNPVYAGFFSDIFSSSSSAQSNVKTLQDIPLLSANLGPELNFGKGGGDISEADNTALVVDAGPLGAANAIDTTVNKQISSYTVRQGDTLSSIAKMFDVSSNTIIWANDIKGGSIQPGQDLVILPVSGILYTVKKGDTLKSIATTYKADPTEIMNFNNITDDSQLVVGQDITIPDAESIFTPPTKSKKTKIAFGINRAHDTNGPDYPGYYLRPTDGIKTQGLHGYNAVDIGAPTGTPIYASAPGDIIISKMGGWNGGYGNYVVITHPNNTQTVYGHMSETVVSVGESVYRGQVIGYVGKTGKATGPHLHFEVRGARNPFQ